MDEEQIVKSRLKDLGDRAYRQGAYTYSNFLTPAELSLLEELRNELSYVGYKTYGGMELCDRQMVCFGNEEQFGYPPHFPISVIKVEPLIEKFSDELTHRDFLGAVMNLGIDRSVLGDILVKDNKRAYIFCVDSIAEFIMEQLTKIKHTNVKTRLLIDEEDLSELAPTLKDVQFIVSAPRFDAIVAAVTKLSRSEALNLFKGKKVTLNGRLCERNSITLKENDIFSIRGYGKYRYLSSGGETRKGRVYVHLQQYI